MYQKTKIDEDLINKYDKPGPRYTSYPTAVEFKEDINYKDYIKELLEINEDDRYLSLYIHMPFCENACWFCGCNVIISHRKESVDPYLNYLFKEIDLLKNYIKSSKKIDQFHIGGGTPNFMSHKHLSMLMDKIRESFNFTEKAEISMELDPRHLSKEDLKFYKELGFNRLSIGVQEFNREVQEAINRVQPKEMIREVVEWVRENNFESLNIDIMYGLPKQKLSDFKNTVEEVINLSPDRVALFNFAYVPWLKPLQRKLNQEELPPAKEKLSMFIEAINSFEEGDYAFIGMDHFAKKTDELYIAQEKKELWRNFQGYTTRKGVHLIGIGATSIGMLYKGYFQNYKTLRDYYDAINKGNLPVMRGILLKEDDIIRREVIMDIMCNLEVDKNKISKAFNIDFDSYFEQELNELKELEMDGLLSITKDSIKINPLGRLMIRNAAMVFDIYTKNKKEQKFSRTI